jgi:hypothetical protein
MPNTAPGAERLTGGVKEDAEPATAARPARRGWRWAGPAVFVLLVVVLCVAYLRLSMTYPENSDEANILLMAHDMLHGNLMLRGWSVSDVPFITTELPQIALLVAIFGLKLNTAHLAAAMTYTLVVAVGLLLAKGRSRGWAAVASMALALGIMLAPQPGVGVFVVIFSVGHIGTALPVLLTWLILDRLGRRPYVPVLVALLLAWALTADPLVLVVAIFPMFAVVAARLVTGLVVAARESGTRGLRTGLTSRWFELALAAAAGVGYLIAWSVGRFISNSGGYTQQPVPFRLDDPNNWWWQSRVVVHGLLEMFGAYFVPGPDTVTPFATPVPALGGLDQAIALTHLVGVVLAVWGACSIARGFFFRDADFVSQLLLAGIVANIFAYIPSTLAAHSALNTREIAPVLPFAAVLAGRMLGGRLLSGPRIRVPRIVVPSRLAQRSGPRPRVRLLAIPLIALFGWYSFGLWQHASQPAAPVPYEKLAKYLKEHHLTYGLGGYWESSIITVETGGSVTIRAVTPACLQPYLWEAKKEWYDQKLHDANFILLSNVPGYFSKFAVSSKALLQLNAWYGQPKYLGTGSFKHNGSGVRDYTARVYPANLLAQLPRLARVLNSPSIPCG